MKDGIDQNLEGLSYPDCLTYPHTRFKITSPAKLYTLKQTDCDRFDLTVYTEYGTTDLDDIVLLYNGITDIHDLRPGSQLYFPTKDDIERFYQENRI